MNRTLSCLCVVLSIVACSLQRSTADDFGSVDSEEANLRSITFIDPDRGWAAGDRGIILHSQDGGLSWHHQPTSTRSDLQQIAMFNSQRGLAIGGHYRPYSRLSQGEVLVTRDGGTSWQQAKEHNLPVVRKLLIGRGGLCVAAGDWSSIYLSSLFVSRDGGESWSPIPSELVGNAVDLAGSIDDFLVLSDRGQLCRVRKQSSTETLVPPCSLFSANEDRMVWRQLLSRGDEWWLIGRDGVVSTKDAGRHWQVQPRSPLVDSLSAKSSGSIPSVWHEQQWCLAPTVGRELLTCQDGDQVAHRKELSNRVHGLCQIDGERLWACGDFGSILSSRDHGKTWRTLRGGESSPALLVISSEPADLPWNLLATESLQGNRRVGLVTIRASSAHSPIDDELVRQAANQLGPSVTYSLLSDENTGDDKGIDRQIQDCLQLAKPAVVVIDQSITTSMRERIAGFALAAGVKRLMELSDRTGQTVHVATAVPASGGLSSDYWLDANAVLSPGRNLPTKLMLNPRFDSTGSVSLSDGLASFTARDSRYTISRKSLPSRRNLQLLQARSMETSWKAGLLRSASTDLVAYQNGLQSILSRMQVQDCDRLWVELSVATNRQPTPEAYQQTLQYMQHTTQVSAVRESPTTYAASTPQTTTDELRHLAKLRMDAIAVSREWQVAFGTLNSVTNANQALHRSQAETDSQVKLAVEWSPFQKAADRASSSSQSPVVAQASYVDSGASSGVQAASSKSVAKVNEGAVDLLWDTHPLVALLSERSESKPGPDDRTAGASGKPVRLVTMLNANRSAMLWSQLLGNTAPNNGAQLNDTAAAIPASCLQAATTQQRPYLDGKFDEPWWPTAVTVGLRGANINATVQAAADHEFVYLAIKVPHQASTVSSAEQKRDMDLSNQRRYRLRLDVDRDLLTAFEFEFDGNGNTRDACDGFTAFDPRWYVASDVSGGQQHVEIAIQKADLGLTGDAATKTWLASIDLQTPGQHSQSLWLPDPREWFPLSLP